MVLLMLSAKGIARVHHVVLNGDPVNYPQSFCESHTGNFRSGVSGNREPLSPTLVDVSEVRIPFLQRGG